MVLLHHITSQLSTLAMHQSKHQMPDHVNRKHEQQQRQQQRYRRFITLFDNKDYKKHYNSGDKSPIVVNDIQPSATGATKTLLDTLGHHTNRVFEGATDAILVPFNWLSHITSYWPLYLICATIIFGLITFFYCSCQNKMTHMFSHQNFDPSALMNTFREQLQFRLPRIN